MILTTSNRKRLSAYRRWARQKAPKIFVDGHYRRAYTLRGERANQLARWEGVEQAIVRVCSNADKNGKDKLDKQMTNRVISLLEDTFLDN